MRARLVLYALCAALLLTVLAGCSGSVYSSGKAAPISQERSPMALKVRTLKTHSQGQGASRP